MLADVAEPGGTEQCVDDGVRQHVRVGMTVEAERMVYSHPSEDQVAAGSERVRVEPTSDPHVVAASCSLMSASTTSRSSGVVSFMFAGSPSTTVTA